MLKRLFLALVLSLSTPVYAQTVPPYHLPTAIQDFLCGMATYGTDVGEDGKSVINQKVDSVLERAEIVYHPFRHLIRKTFPFLHISNYYPRPTISFDIPEDPLVAGYYEGEDNRIDFNPVYVNKFTYGFVENVVVHETAHLVDYFNHKRYYDKNSKADPHGSTWKETVYQLGGNNNATYHQYILCYDEDPHSIWFDSGLYKRTDGGKD